MRLAIAIIAITLTACALPNPGSPCGTPVDYKNGYWLTADGTVIAHTPTEDSTPTVWNCTPDATLVAWFDSLDD
jgi:hypothetical protein